MFYLSKVFHMTNGIVAFNERRPILHSLRTVTCSHSFPFF